MNPAAAAGGAALGLALFFPPGDEMAAAARFLEDAVALHHLGEATQQLLGVFPLFLVNDQQADPSHGARTLRPGHPQP